MVSVSVRDRDHVRFVSGPEVGVRFVFGFVSGLVFEFVSGS